MVVAGATTAVFPTRMALTARQTYIRTGLKKMVYFRGVSASNRTHEGNKIKRSIYAYFVGSDLLTNGMIRFFGYGLRYSTYSTPK